MIDNDAMEYIVFNTGKAIKRILVGSIVYISKSKNGCELWFATGGGTFDSVHITNSIHDYEDKLLSAGFRYAHNSYMVNYYYIREINGDILVLNNGDMLNISRSKKKEFVEGYKQFYK